MRGVLVIPSMVAVMGLAFWAYQENYRTQAAAREAEEVAQEIAALRERLSLMEAEWAYLNRPARLSRLTDLSFPHLGLLPFLPEQFGSVDDVPARPNPIEQILSGAVETRGIPDAGTPDEEDLP